MFEKTSFAVKFGRKMELTVDTESDTIFIETYETDLDGVDYEADDMEISRADARTLGQLLLRFADTGALHPKMQ